MKYKAIIFDLDGTVLNNEDLWSQAFLKVFASLGIHDLKKSPHQKGIGLKANWATMIDQFHIQTNLSLTDLDHATHEAYFQLIDQIKLRSGFENYAQSLKNGGVKLALATSSHRPAVDYAVNKFRLNRFFEIIVTSEDVEHTKPDPETFLLAASKLGVSPQDCLVYEDAEAGIQAAQAAGMEVIKINDKDSFEVHTIV